MLVVVDDYHYVTEPSIHESLAFLAEHASGRLALVLLSRTKSAAPLARLRGRGLSSQLGGDALALTVEETAEVLGNEAEVTLTSDTAERLHRRTEGWAVGVYLAGMSLGADLAGALSEGSVYGDDEAFVDYFHGEFLARQTPVRTEFLIRISVLDRFCPSLCAAVTGRSDSALIIDALVSGNCMVVKLDRRRQWHRCHHLFRDLLRAELERTAPELVPRLHRDAAIWFHERGLGLEAVGHTIDGEQWELAVDLIGHYWSEQRDVARFATLEGWLGALPAGMVDRDATLLLARANVSLSQGRIENALADVRAASVVSLEEGTDPKLTADCQTGVALTALMAGDTGLAESAATGAIRICHQAGIVEGGRAFVVQGIAAFWRSSEDEARQKLERAVERAMESQHHGMVLMAWGYLAALETDAVRGGARAEDALAHAKATGWNSNILSAVPHVIIARSRRLTGDLEGAQSALDIAINLERGSASPLRNAYCLLEAAELRYAKGHSPDDELKEARWLLAQCADPGNFNDEIALASARFRVEVDLDAASGDLPDPLTEREIAVLTYLASAHTQREIAASLFVSMNTVKSQVAAVYRKLGVSSRSAAVRRGAELGITSFDRPGPSEPRG